MEKLEATVRTLKEREREARTELDSWVREEKSKEGTVSLMSLATMTELSSYHVLGLLFGLLHKPVLARSGDELTIGR